MTNICDEFIAKISSSLEVRQDGESDSYILWSPCYWDYVKSLDWSDLVKLAKAVLAEDEKRGHLRCSPRPEEQPFCDPITGYLKKAGY